MSEFDATEQAYRNGEAGKADALKWISVKDRLPENDRLVLGVMKQKFHFVGFYRESASTWHVADQVASKKAKFEVTHWMPLPQPPEDDA